MRSLRDAGLAAALANSSTSTPAASVPKSTVAHSNSSPDAIVSTAASNNSSSGVVVSTVGNSIASMVVTTSAQAVVRATAENSLPGNSSEGSALHRVGVQTYCGMSKYDTSTSLFRS